MTERAASPDRWKQLEEILAGRVTLALDEEEWAGCVAEATRRIEAEEPPGYIDADKQETLIPVCFAISSNGAHDKAGASNGEQIEGAAENQIHRMTDAPRNQHQHRRNYQRNL